MSLTIEEAERLIERAVERAIESAVERALAKRPPPTHVSVSEAAEILGVSTKTVTRLKLPRNACGKIPYEAVLSARASRN